MKAQNSLNQIWEQRHLSGSTLSGGSDKKYQVQTIHSDLSGPWTTSSVQTTSSWIVFILIFSLSHQKAFSLELSSSQIWFRESVASYWTGVNSNTSLPTPKILDFLFDTSLIEKPMELKLERTYQPKLYYTYLPNFLFPLKLVCLQEIKIPGIRSATLSIAIS